MDYIIVLIVIFLIALLYLIMSLKMLYLYFFNKKEYDKLHNRISPKILTANWDSGRLILNYSNNKTESFIRISDKFYELPMMNLCSDNKQTELSQIDRYIQEWNGDYPNAHLKQKNNK